VVDWQLTPVVSSFSTIEVMGALFERRPSLLRSEEGTFALGATTRDDLGPARCS